MTARIALTAVYEPVEQGWVQARLAELPAVITAAPTLDAARELLADALREYLLSLAESPSTARGQNGAAHSEPLEIVIRDGAAVGRPQVTLPQGGVRQ